MSQSGRVTQDIILSPGRDYEVIRGKSYRYHDEDTCDECSDLPLGSLKLHHTFQARRHPVYRPMAVNAAPFQLYLLPSVELRQSAAPFVTLTPPRLPQALGSLGSMGNILGDIFGFIEDIINSILNTIESVLKSVMHALANPLQGLKDLIQFNVDMITGKIFLDVFKNMPIIRYLYIGVDELTGGFLTNLSLLSSLPGRFIVGKPISRSDLLKALSALKVILVVAIGVLTGGATIAIIGATAGLLKAGPLGKTALGRTLLDIAAIGAGAYMGDVNIITAFINAGQSKLTSMGILAVAGKLGLNAAIVGLTSLAVSSGVKAASGSGGDSEDEDNEDIEEGYWDDETQDVSSSGDSGEDYAPATDSGDGGDNGADDISSDVDQGDENYDESDAVSDDGNEPEDTSSEDEGDQTDTQDDSETSETEALDDQVTEDETDNSANEDEQTSEDESASEDDGSEEDDTEEESGISDDDLAEILKAGLSLTNLATTLLKEGATPKQAAAGVKQAKRIIAAKTAKIPTKKVPAQLTPAQLAERQKTYMIGAGLALVLLAALSKRKKA
jgi:hypothetical protein